MKIKELIQSIIINRKSNPQIQTFEIVKNKNRIKCFIGSAIIITCAAFYQTGTRAQMKQEFSAKTEPATLSANGLIQTSPIDEKENNINPDASLNIPSIYPVAGRLTDVFGNRANPFSKKRSEFHPGLDIAAPIGTPVNAAADGFVMFAGWQRGYGNIVIIDHGDGLTTRYGHLSRINTSVGQKIKTGDELGKVGSTGRSTGAHLHYEVRVNNQAVDPIQYLPLN